MPRKAPGLATYRLAVEYAGTRYSGWQQQRGARTVAGEIIKAVADFAGPELELGGSGRTDAGVHALAQTAHLRLGRSFAAGELQEAVNGRLPADIHLREIRPAPASFHARHDAVSRTYLYQVSRRRTALAKPFVWWVRRRLDAARMAEAAAGLPGRRDYAGFCEGPEDHPSTVVVVESVQVAEAGALILIRLTASHFLRKMVRRLVGALVLVGGGDLGAADFAAILGGAPAPARLGEPASWTAPPSGLFLAHVGYPGEDGPPPLAPAVPVS